MYRYDVIDQVVKFNENFKATGKTKIFDRFFTENKISVDSEDKKLVAAKGDIFGFSYQYYKESETKVLINFHDLNHVIILSNKKIFDFSSYSYYRRQIFAFSEAVRVKARKAALTFLDWYLFGGDQKLIGMKDPNLDFSTGYSNQIEGIFVYKNIKDFLQFWSNDSQKCLNLLKKISGTYYKMSDLYIALDVKENNIILDHDYNFKHKLLIQESKKYIEQNFKDY